MPTKGVTPQRLAALARLVKNGRVLIGTSVPEDYRRDMGDFTGRPAAVVRPSDERELQRIVRWAARNRVPLVPRGGGSSVTGAVVSDDAVIVDLAHWRQILEINPVDWYVRVQPGVVLDELNKQLRAQGFFFPPDPASSFICHVGGAIAEGAGGLRCVKYGTVKDWVLALRVILPSGEIIQLGEPLAKNRAGYDLVHLFVGSEGTLGIVTEAWLKILPLPRTPIRRMMILFDSWEAAGRAIQGLRRSQIVPNIMEFMDRGSLAAVRSALQIEVPVAEAVLLVDIEEQGQQEVFRAREVFRDAGAREIMEARDAEEAERMYTARTGMYLAVRTLSSGRLVEDVVVPVSRLVDYLREVQRISERFGVRIIVSGHAGDGNVHPNILYEVTDPRSIRAAVRAFEAICRFAIRIGGSVTGEHGVGIQKTHLLKAQLDAHGGRTVLPLMQSIKRLFDPRGIMNPGKYVEAAGRRRGLGLPSAVTHGPSG